jgi:DNA-binding Lrp family transcriptional regulator
VASLLNLRKPARPRERFAALQWADLPLQYDSPRFGVAEAPSKGGARDGWVLLVANALRREPPHLAEWVLWREAFLEHLDRRIRLVSEAADLGLYGGLKYGIQDFEHRQPLQSVWETVSPPKYYGFYRYFPTGGFAAFDNVVDGAFPQNVIPRLNALRGDKHVPLSSATFTATLERWMMETHRTLNETEARILTVLSATPKISQRRLAEQLKISPAALSQSLAKLAGRHLLRVSGSVDFPLIGLDHLVVFLRLSGDHEAKQLRNQLVRLRYALSTIRLPGSLLITDFLVPHRFSNQFSLWNDRLCRTWNLPPPSLRLVTDLVQSWNFHQYTAGIGWATDFSSTIDLIHDIVSGNSVYAAPPLRTFKYSYNHLVAGQLFPLRLHRDDFIYFQRSIDAFSVGGTVFPRSASEARQMGFSGSSYRLYRRRVRRLDELGVSVPTRIGLLHVGLDTAIHVFLSAPRETTERVLRASQLLPHISGYILDDGTGTMTLLLPNAVAVEVFSFLRRLFAECSIDAQIAIRQAWESFAWFPSPISKDDYDFEKGEWIWKPETLPALQKSAD